MAAELMTDELLPQMEALQRIHVFRLFDAYSLRDRLSTLRSGGLLQVGFATFAVDLAAAAQKDGS